ncbi:hypothetical protein FYJ38_06135 [Clostridium sp. WB02_MRS01]|nr:hypothetical protein [Clostridium sp. WB02_MRS01]
MSVTSSWIFVSCRCTWVSPGDFGDRRGKYTPGWWLSAQYGILKRSIQHFLIARIKHCQETPPTPLPLISR